MTKYRKKPVVVDAIQWTGSNREDVMAISEGLATGITFNYHSKKTPDIVIDTLEGKMKANVGDYIIKGVANELYPCKSDIFEKTYEKVDE